MTKVCVGLSGGVDSAVSAALLQRKGYDVTGVFIKIWSPEFLECTWREDRLEAKRVASHLGIPFLEIDLSKEYLTSVVDDMIEKYRAGVTPNPDVLCNRTIKFGAFSEWAFAHGADYVATGHYAQIKSIDGKSVLCKGVDASKDQSYFLYRLRGDELSRILFPVGGYTKVEIRAHARKFALPNADRPDSQGLCFVGDVSMPEFLGRFIPLKKGVLKDARGNVIGEHDGAALYTVGQRHGFRLSAHALVGPYYVTSVDIHENVVYVSKTKKSTEHTRARFKDMHWIHHPEKNADAVSRYHGERVKAHITEGDGVSHITFESPLLITPGQSLVLYRDEVCLGGGTIAP
jgi:tRNA-specific 2-thiouridylase